jgi:predicted RNase H-like HicB family nuclease
VTQLTIKIEYDSTDKIYVARALELGGCVTFGLTLEDAIRNINEAVALHLESIELHK